MLASKELKRYANVPENTPSIFLIESEDDAMSETDFIKGSAAPAVVSYKKSASLRSLEFIMD